MERFKYLFNKKIYISEIDETYLEFKDKKLVTTMSFLNELIDVYNKDMNLVVDILKNGEHIKESRNKIYVKKQTTNGFWELVYVEYNGEITLIHLKLRRR